MNNYKREVSNIEEILLLLINIIVKGKFEKTEEGYLLQFGDIKKYIVELKIDRIEFKIPTIKWVSGSYEPIEGSELYKSIEYNELKDLSEEGKITKLREVVEEL